MRYRSTKQDFRKTRKCGFPQVRCFCVCLLAVLQVREDLLREREEDVREVRHDDHLRLAQVRTCHPGLVALSCRTPVRARSYIAASWPSDSLTQQRYDGERCQVPTVPSSAARALEPRTLELCTRESRSRPAGGVECATPLERAPCHR